MLSVDKLRRTELSAREREHSVLMSVVEVLLRLHHSNTATQQRSDAVWCLGSACLDAAFGLQKP